MSGKKDKKSINLVGGSSRKKAAAKAKRRRPAQKEQKGRSRGRRG